MYLMFKSGKGLSPLSSTLYLTYLNWFFASTWLVLSAAAAREMWPWIAFIPALKCTGAIVHDRWLLTSSQCFKNRSKIPSELYVEVQEITKEGKITGVKRVFVVDYSRDKRQESIHGLTMVYLARTVPSLTQKTVAVRANKSTSSKKSAIVLSWDSVASKIGFDSTVRIMSGGVNIFALSVGIAPCVDRSRQLCASFEKHLSSASGIALYCSRVSLGSPLIVFDKDGTSSLIAVLHKKADCQPNSKVIGRFSRVDYATLWIHQQFRIQDFPQCQPNIHQNLDDRLRDLRKERTGPSNLCDSNITRAWYRFTLQGQPAELPTSCPHSNACGSFSSVWLPQGHKVEIGKQVEVKACATWKIGQRYMCCFWRFSVFIRHCGDFKVYRLRRTDTCPTSYCVNVTKGHCGVGKTGYKPNCKDSYPKLPKVLKLYPLHAYQGKPKRPHVYLRCLLSGILPTGRNIKYSFVLYKLEKRVDGTLKKHSIRSIETSRKYFDTLFIPETRGGIRLGDTIVCVARSFFLSTKDIKSLPLSSNVYHLGIEVDHPSKTVLSRSHSLDITFSITLPVLCPKKNSNCSLIVPLTTSLSDVKRGHEVAMDSHLTLSKCSLMFTPKRCSRDKIVCGRDKIRLKLGNNFRNSDLRLQIKLGPLETSDWVWKDSKLPHAEVTLKRSSRFTCTSMSATNIKTFDGRFFKHLGEGTFLFYRSVSPPLEVQIRKWRCSEMSTCPCAVAVRESNDTIIADMCNGQYKKTSLRFILRSKLPLHNLTRIIESSDGKTFTIRLPSGSRITIDEFEWGVSVHLSAVGLGESRGLCRGKHISSRQEKLKSLFDSPVSTLKPAFDTNEQFCGCYGRKTLNLSGVDCSQSTIGVSLKDGSHDITQKILDKQRILQEGFIPYSKTHLADPETLQADSPNLPRLPLSYERKRAICEEILNGTDGLGICKNALGNAIWKNMWQICLQETQENHDFSLVRSNGKTIVWLCEQKLDEYEDYHNLVRKWKKDLCENRCSRNGHCYNGYCKCNKGYGSSDCSIPLNKPPKLFYLDYPLCDRRHKLCEEIFLTGTPFLKTQSLSCKFTPVQRVGSVWKEDSRRMFIGEASFYSARGVTCTIPRDKRSKVVKSQEAFHIRVSNNGREWSDPILRVTYDSLCQNCSDIRHCVVKPGTCDIESRCFVNGDIHSKNRCLKCSSLQNPYKWSERKENLPPVFISPLEETVTVFVNDLVSFVVKATDPEGQQIKITHDVPQALLNAKGEFRWRPDKEEKKTIQVLATDECGASAAKYVEVNIRQCLCRNSGKCPKTATKYYRCLCPETFEGIYCERKVFPCLSNPCFYGKCANNGDNFRCICDVGYYGDTCQLKIRGCSSNPCKRGSCEDLNNEFRCKCPQSYEGRLCEKHISPCSRAPCVRGTCRAYKENDFECICPQGFHGKTCAQKTIHCSPNPCNVGRCVKMGTSLRCFCPEGYHGKFCNLTGVYCANKSCINGVCESTKRGQRCACRKGFTGEKCEIACAVDCVHGECVVSPSGASCVCHEEYTGDNCNIKRNACEPNPCMNGRCLDRDDSFLCRCYPGYTGTLCNISACSSFDCGNGTCTFVNGIPVCSCFEGFYGDHCERRVQPCDSNPCYSGLCITAGDSFTCSCNPGYEGLLCERKINPCFPNPCGANGFCRAIIDGTFSCACDVGYSGVLCKKKENPCLSNPCVYGSCMVTSNGEFHCTCNSGYVGRLCQIRFDICSSNPCKNGRCSSIYQGTFSCLCPRGFSGTLCEVDGRPCTKNPCFEGVACTNLGSTYKCGACPLGFVGDGVRCRPVVTDAVKKLENPCPRQFCYPGVKCSIIGSQIHCGDCPNGFYGNGFNCQVLCKISCLNGGKCVAPGVCQCPPGFLGATCSGVGCKRRCLNGGRCISPDKCYCPFGFYGKRCEKARCHIKCLNGGRCTPPNKCQCSRGYTGQRCEQAMCPLPCLNGGLCVKPGICRCPPGYFGTRCQEGTCFPQCRNGGTCVRNNICACPKGYRGHRCQTAVCRRPCQNGGRCFKKDQCSCPYGYHGETCQYVHCLRPCLNGGVCIKPNVCLCPTSYAGVSCQFYVG